MYGLGSVKIKQIWYLGEALPAMLVGIILGPIAAKLIDSERWGHAVEDQTAAITLVSLFAFPVLILLTFHRASPES